MSRPGIRDAGGGFVLIAVLGTVALLSGFTVALTLWSRNAADGALLASAQLRTDALLEAGANLAAYQLFAAGQPPEALDGQQIRLDSGTVTVFVSSEAGKADLNGSGPDLLQAAYRAAGLAAMPPARFAALVAEWRSNGEADPKKTKGAPKAGSKRPGAPPKRPFRSIEELRFVKGLRPGEIEALRPYVTVYNPLGKLDVFGAPSQLIAALPGIKPADAGQVVALRAQRDPKTTDRLATLLSRQAELLRFEPPTVYRVRVEAQAAGELATRLAEAVIIKSSTSSRLFQTVAWRQR